MFSLHYRDGSVIIGFEVEFLVQNCTAHCPSDGQDDGSDNAKPGNRPPLTIGKMTSLLARYGMCVSDQIVHKRLGYQ